MIIDDIADRAGGYSYGWNVDNTANAENCSALDAPDERYDTLNELGGEALWKR